MKHIVIAICTTRKEDLPPCLQSLQAQTLPPEYRATILVVNNAPQEASIARIAAETQGPIPIAYVEEAERGISEARNRAVAYALEHTCDLLAFIDDDERADASWISSLLKTQETHHADIVTGPVAPQIVDAQKQWMAASVPFKKDHHATGQRMRVAYTHNILIRRAVLETIRPAFDPDFSKTGGGDTHFSTLAAEKGFTIIWCQQAVVTEQVPSSRTRFYWVLCRGYRVGAAWTLMQVKKPNALMRILPRLFLRAARAAVLLLAGVLTFSRARILSGCFYAAQTAGTMLGYFGLQYQEYANRSGGKKNGDPS